MNGERAGLDGASQELSLYHAKYREESLMCRDQSSVASSGGRTRTASMTVVFLKEGAISCEQRFDILVVSQDEEALADIG